MTTRSRPGVTGRPDVARWPARTIAPGPLRVAMAVVVLAIVGICGFSGIARVGQPFAGFFVWENGFVPAVGLPTWNGSASGLIYHSWLESIDGRPFDTVSALTSAVAERPIGSPVALEASFEGRRYQVAVPTQRFDFEAFAVSTGVFLFDAVVLAVLGVVMLWVKPGDAGAQAVAAFAFVQALFLATSIDLFGPYRFRSLYFFFAGLTPTATLWMLSRFPLQRTRHAWENAALGVALAASLAFGILSNLWFFTNRAGLLALDTLIHMAMAASALSAFAFFAWHFRRATNQLVRQRCKVVLLGSLGSFLPTMVFLVAFYGGLMSLPFNFLAVPFVLFPIGIGYAVAKHDLFDVDTIIKRTVVYATLSTMVFGFYSAAIGVFDFVFSNATPVASRTAEGVVILFLVLATNPSRQRIQEIVNRLYDRRRYEYRDVVRSASRAFTTILGFDTLMPAVLTLIDETLQPTFADIYTMDWSGIPRLRGRLTHAPGDTAEVHAIAVEVLEPTLSALAVEAARREILTDPAAIGAVSGVDTSGWIDEGAGSSLAAGMALEGHPVGLVLVGPRRAGGLYTKEDIDLLRTIASQLAIALRNAESFKTIESLNQDLEGKNVALHDALVDLRQAQDELIIKERLAAVGEIAGAVAHTIRNPLAGMRATAQQASIELGEHPSAELVDFFVRETDRLSARIDALLDFSRPFHRDAKPSSLGDIAREAVSQVRARAAAKQQVINVETAAQATLAPIDPVLFEQLTIELLANAVDAAPEGGRIAIAVGSADGIAWLEVRDSGPGIAAAKRDELFRLFFTTKPRGTGIGLATVKKIADAHGGSVAVTTAPEGGACFRVEVPDRLAQASYLESR